MRQERPSPKQLALAALSRCKPGEDIDPWGVARKQGIEPLAADYALQALVKEGKAYREGNFYRPSNSFRAELEARKKEIEKEEKEIREKFFLG